MMLRKSTSNCTCSATYTDTRWSATLDPWRRRYSIVKQFTHNMEYRLKVVNKSKARCNILRYIRLRDPLRQRRIYRRRGTSGRRRKMRLCTPEALAGRERGHILQLNAETNSAIACRNKFCVRGIAAGTGAGRGCTAFARRLQVAFQIRLQAKYVCYVTGKFKLQAP